MIPEAGRILDFDFLTSKHIVVLETSPAHSAGHGRGLDLPVVPHRCRLTVLHLSTLIHRNTDVVYHSSTQPPSSTFHHFLAHNCWTLDDCAEDSVAYVLSLELPPMLDPTRPGTTPASALYGSVSIYPQQCEANGQISFTLGCRGAPTGVAMQPSRMLRGAIAAALISGLISSSVVNGAITTALGRWEKYLKSTPDVGFALNDETRERLDHATAKVIEQHRRLPFASTEPFRMSSEGAYRFTNGAKLFETIVAAADVANFVSRAAPCPSVRPMALVEDLGGLLGLEHHGKVFADLLPPLSTTRRDLPITEFRQWCTYADIEVLHPTPNAAAYGDRVVYIDPVCDRGTLRKPPTPSTAGSAEGSFTLVMRNYSMALGCVPLHYAMDAAKWYWPSRYGCAGRGREVVPNTRPARYVKCSCPTLGNRARGLHTPWLGEEVMGVGQLKPRAFRDEVDGEQLEVESPFAEARVPVACGRGGVQGVWFDGQTIVVARGDVATLLCF